MMSKWVRWIWLPVLTALVGCGGGSSLEDDDGGGGTPPPTPAADTVSISLWACDSFDLSAPDITGCNETNEINTAPPTVILVEATSGDSPASGQKIVVTTDKGQLSQTDGSALTNASGQAFLTISAGQDTGVATLNATFNDATDDLVAEVFGTPVVSTKAVAVTLWDCPPQQDGCQQITDFSAAAPAVIVVNATEDNSPAQNKKVTIASDKGELSRTDGVVLTDDNGFAMIDIAAGSDSGIVTIGAEFDDANDELFATINEVQISLQISSPLGDGEELSDGSTLPVTATLTTDSGEPYLAPVEVTFSSTCTTAGKAILDDSIQSTGGTAIATYRPDGCETEDIISASVELGSSSDTDNLRISIADTPVGNIEFVSAEPRFINLQGTGGQTTSMVSFKVTDANGRAKQGQDVSFNLASGADKVELSQVTAISDNDGLVTTTVRSGSLPGSARVQAVVDGSDPIIATVSSELAIGVGLPDADSFSLSFDVHNPEAWNYDGEEVAVTIRAADHFNNPVSDGTSISFVAEGGAIEPSCETQGGVCTVLWRSQNFRPENARVTILAYAEGEESFYDNNGNGLFEHTQDSFTGQYDVGEAYRDDDEDGIYNNNDQLIDRDLNGSYDGPDGIYNGQLCTEDSANAGACTQQLVDVSADSVIVMAGNAPEVYFCAWDGTNLDCTQRADTLVGVTDAYVCARDTASDGETINPVAAETQISFSPSDPLKLRGTTSFLQASTNQAIYHPYLGIDNRANCGAGLYRAILDLSEGPGELLVEMSTPKGVYSSDSVSIELAP
ncbi:hypothetical protein GCM10011369_26810 [Neiella marina]|uniref:Invasin domain-containing protein n=1 Tax=Neiella marina TaxID=508461 RepID=A0A8J2U7F0_9GAMM|nr:invasin domain 3-containing protein [Neiella marina]GGA83465.1 hypothetical protein GCM10011369_26810 [Neiella marina]